jgi:hypothetical protein
MAWSARVGFKRHRCSCLTTCHWSSAP